MTARTYYRLTAAGACLLLTANLSAAGDALPERASPHFFPGRILRSNAAALVEQHAPANLPPAEPPSLATKDEATQDARPALDRSAPTETPLLQPRPELETRSS